MDECRGETFLGWAATCDCPSFGASYIDLATGKPTPIGPPFGGSPSMLVLTVNSGPA